MCVCFSYDVIRYFVIPVIGYVFGYVIPVMRACAGDCVRLRDPRYVIPVRETAATFSSKTLLSIIPLPGIRLNWRTTFGGCRTRA